MVLQLISFLFFFPFPIGRPFIWPCQASCVLSIQRQLVPLVGLLTPISPLIVYARAVGPVPQRDRARAQSDKSNRTAGSDKLFFFCFVAKEIYCCFLLPNKEPALVLVEAETQQGACAYWKDQQV